MVLLRVAVLGLYAVSPVSVHPVKLYLFQNVREGTKRPSTSLRQVRDYSDSTDRSSVLVHDLRSSGGDRSTVEHRGVE